MAKFNHVDPNNPNAGQLSRQIANYLLEHDFVTENEDDAFLKTDGTRPSTGLQDFQLGIKTNTVVESTSGSFIGINNLQYNLVSNGAIAAGTNQATATLISAQWTSVGTVSVNTKGMVLPVGQPGMMLILENNAANSFNLYPGASSKINGGSANAAITINVGEALLLYQLSASTGWHSFSINPAGISYLANGAVGTPSMTFASDTDTGIYRVGTNQLGFTANGVLQAVISVTGLNIDAVTERTTGAGTTFSTMLITGAGFVMNRTSQATNYVATIANNYIAMDSTAAIRSVTLPLANAVPAGWALTVKDKAGTANTNNITIARAGADTIDGATSFVFATNYQSATFVSNGVNGFEII